MAFTLNRTRDRITAAHLYGEPASTGAGTVTEIDPGADITLVPNPIVGTGTVGVTAGTFVRADGTQPLTADWDAGLFSISAKNSMPMFNMMEYGANPNGVFDNSAVMTAIHADLPANGGIIVVPNGTSYIASTITFTKPAWFIGTTPDSSRLSFRDNGDGFIFSHAGGQAIKFTDVALLVNAGGGGTAGALVHCSAAANFPFLAERCYFGNFFEGIRLESNWFSSLSNCRFAGAHAAVGGSSVVIDNLVAMDQGGLHVEGCTFAGNSSYSVRQRAGGGTTLVDNFFIHGAGHVASVLLDIPAAKTTGDLIISSNNFEGEAATTSILLAADGTFTNILIEGNEFATFPSVTAIQVVPTATGVLQYGVISGNTMWHGDYAVEFGPGQVAGADTWRVDGNIFSSQVVAGIKLPAVAARVARLTIGQNQFVSTGANSYLSGSFDTTSGFDSVYVGTGASVAGSTPWTAPITVNENTAAPPAPLAGTQFHVVAADSASNRLCLDTFAADGRLNFRRAAGTGALPSAVAIGTDLGGIAAFGYGATGYSAAGRAIISAYAGETWTDAAQGAGYIIKTTPTGGTATAEKARLTPGGNLLVGTTTDTGSKAVVNGSVEIVNGSGGGYKFQDGSIQMTAVGVGGACPSSRLVSTTAPLAGGGDLTADRTLSIAVTPVNDGGAVALQAVTPGIQQTGNTSISGVAIAGTGLQVGIAPSGTPVANVRVDHNTVTDLSIENQNAGATSLTQYDLQSDVANADLELYASGYGGTGARQANAAGLIANTNATGGVSIAAQAFAPIRFYTNGITSGDLRVSIRNPMGTDNGILAIRNILTFVNNAAALAGGLVAGDIYAVTATDPRQLAIVF